MGANLLFNDVLFGMPETSFITFVVIWNLQLIYEDN